MEFQSIVIGTAALMLLVSVPGYALSLALFPRRDELDFSERIGFSFVLGFVPWTLEYFLDKNFGFPVNGETTLGFIAFATIAGLAVWKIRQGRQSAPSGG
jgi:hypothetical protein